MKALVVAEHSDALTSLCAGARTLADEVIAIAFGEVADNIADSVIKVEIPEGSPLDDAADTVIAAFDTVSPDVVLAESTRHLKTIIGKLAAAKNSSVITDAMSIEDGVASTMYFGGVGVRKLKAKGLALYLLSPDMFADLEASGNNEALDVAWVAPVHPMKLISTTPIQKSDVDLSKADVVVGAGRGFAEEADLDLARALCDKISAGLGCSRPLTEGVDWLPTETYIGVSGLMLAPSVYLAAGISGQMQHMVGINRAGTVFAINKDKNAPIFKQCDYGIVGDIKTVIPALLEVL